MENEMKNETIKRTYSIRDMHNIKQIHTDYIKEQEQSIRRLEWVIAASLGASAALTFVLIHQIFFL